MATKSDLTRTKRAKSSLILGILCGVGGAIMFFALAISALGSASRSHGALFLFWFVGALMFAGLAVYSLFVYPFMIKKGQCPNCGATFRFDASEPYRTCSGCNHRLRYSDGRLIDLGSPR